MILQTMTPEEKLRQAEKIKPMIKRYVNKYAPKYEKTFLKAARYPCVVFLPETTFDGMGKWTVVISAQTKSDIKKGYINIQAFQTFHVEHSKNPMNNGLGIYFICPNADHDLWLYEYPPHYFSRLRERYIAPKGIVQPDFKNLVREVVRMQGVGMNVILEGDVVRGEDGKYDIVPSSNTRQEGYDNFVCYHNEGLDLGVRKGWYFHYTTFVNNDLLRNGQRDFQRQMIKDCKDYELKRRYAPEMRFEDNTIVEDVDF